MKNSHWRRHQRTFVIEFFIGTVEYSRRNLSRRRFRHWHRQYRRRPRPSFLDLAPITTVAHDFESFCAQRPQ